MGLILGVDPGATGALMLIDTADRRIAAGLDMPVLRYGSWKLVDGAAALAWVQAQQIDRIVVERADCMPNDAKAAAVQFGRVVGGIASVLIASGRPLELAAPSAWKARAGLLHQGKEASRDLARVTFGADAAATWFSLKKHHDRAEAALLALYGATGA